MNRILTPCIVVVLLGAPSLAWGGAKEDVAAATQAWVDAMNSRDPDRVVALYDPQAVLWGTVSPALRDSPAAIRDYFKGLPNFPPESRVVVGDQRIRVHGDMAINTGNYTFSTARDGQPVSFPARFSFVYRKQDGRWLIVDHHSSSVPKP